jgi:asparagine synthase (glutamine-hydrolysing)
MCGIFAAVGPELSGRALDHVFDALHHRGPDGRGLFIDEAASLTIAHTRLAIIDLVTGEQPMASEDGEIVLSANGEIYDFERIRSGLEAKGYRFKTRSDSEVIIYLYKEYGLRCFEHLRGEFAFLLYDKAKKQLIAARDRFGIKPLYLARPEGGFVFASEMKAIFASGLVAAKLNASALDPFVEQDPAKARFPFEGIEHVPPGCYVAVDLDTLQARTERYWSAEIPAETAEPVRSLSDETGAKAAALVLDQLEEAVRLRLRADVPVGLYLSGGIDSAFVGALMKRNLKTQLHSFSIAFVGSGRNEQEFAARAAEVIGTEHHELAVSKQALWDNLEQALWFSELPFVSLAPVGKFLLSELARGKVTVVLTGEGADEIFLGYRSFFRNAIRETRSGESGVSAQRRRLKIGSLAEILSLRLFHKSQRDMLKAARATRGAHAIAKKPLINAVQEERLAAMPLDILAYLGDREEMAHSLEARLPFLDHHLYDAAKFIPVDLKMRDGVEKAVLRDAAKGIVPDDLRMRRKSGFMLTSDAADFFGADRTATEQMRARYLSKDAFERAGIFSYRAYRLARLIARSPPRRMRRLRRNANKVVMYMMQTHMLHEMFVAEARWQA